MARKPYPSDVTDEEWAFVAPYLTLMREDAPQREHPLREVFNAESDQGSNPCRLTAARSVSVTRSHLVNQISEPSGDQSAKETRSAISRGVPPESGARQRPRVIKNHIGNCGWRIIATSPVRETAAI